MDPASAALSDVEHEQDEHGQELGDPMVENVADESTSGAPARTTIQKLACDHCRNRKVRCDRQDPCSRCVHMRIQCNYTAQPRSRPKRPQALLYKNKIDELSSKIDTICRLLEGGAGQVSSNSYLSHRERSPAETTVTMSCDSTQSTPADKMEPSEAEYEGDSALSAHTAFATKFLEAVVGQELSPRHDESASKSGQNQVFAFPSLSMPPASIVFNCLQILQGSPDAATFWTFELESTAHFQEYFLKVYSSSQPTAAEQIIGLCSIASLFFQCAFLMKDPAQKKEFQRHGEACHRDLERAIFRLPFHLPTSFDYILALSMAVDFCVEKCRPMLAWNLNCVAVRMSLSLGFHKAHMQDPERSVSTRRRARLFVVLYMSDKMLSLRLGRGSMIRDVEIPQDYRMMLRGVNSASSQVAPFWVGIARIQGLVYDQLYSPRALQQPQEVRYAHARGLLQELDAHCNAKDEIKDQFDVAMARAIGDDEANLLQRADKVSRLALKCLIYRGVQPFAVGLPFYEDCIHHAREALIEHHQSTALFAKHEVSFLEMYFHWAFLSSPFVPFIIILCNVVETHNLDDLELLRIMIVSIEGIRETIPAVSKQLRVFQPLYEVLSRFIEAKTASQPSMGNFGAFFQESNVGISLAPALLSTFAQSEQLDRAREGQGYADTSFLDIWMQLDSSQTDSPAFQG